jgi:small-conductance mechanosensitive channel
MGGHMGDVIDIRLFLTYILECGKWVDADQSTGRIVMLPNGMVFQAPVANFTRGFDHIWDEIPVLVTFESDWRLAKQLLTEINSELAAPLARNAQQQLKQTARDHALFLRNLTPIVYTAVHDCGVMLTLRYLTPARQRRANREKIWEAILDAFSDQDGIDFAYPTRRTYINYIEGKPGARAEAPGSPAGLPGRERKEG